MCFMNVKIQGVTSDFCCSGIRFALFHQEMSRGFKPWLKSNHFQQRMAASYFSLIATSVLSSNHLTQEQRDRIW